MFGSKALSLPSPFAPDHRPQRLYPEPARSQQFGQCHFLVLHTGSKEQRCPCQGFQHDRNSPGSLCDCTHAACYHAHSTPTDPASLYETQTPGLVGRIKKLEEAVHAEREIRDNMLARERQLWGRELRILREALVPFYKSEQDMQQNLADIERRLDESIKEQALLMARITSIEDAGMSMTALGHGVSANGLSTDQRVKPTINDLGPHDTAGLYSGSEDRTSVSTESMSPRPSTNILSEPESPRSSGILNLVELPRAPMPRYALPPRLSPPAEPEEPRSSGFLSLDVKELIQRRRVTKSVPTSHPYGSPASSFTKSPPDLVGRNATSQSLHGISSPGLRLAGKMTDLELRAHKKRKHQSELMALDVLADVSAASPVIS